MLRNHTGYVKESLNWVGGGDSIVPLPSTSYRASLKSLPATNGRGFAYYLSHLLLQITGTYIVTGTAGTDVLYDDMVRALIGSVGVDGCWHGSPLNSNVVLGAYLPLLSFVMSGYQRNGDRAHAKWTSTSSGTFNLNIPIPLSIAGLGVKGAQTAQLAAMYENGTFVLNMAPSSVISALSSGGAFTSMTARISAMLIASPELILGPPIEAVLYQAPAVTGGGQHDFDDFGNMTSLSGTERVSGLIWAMLLSSLKGLGGAFTADAITSLTVPFRRQPQTFHVRSFISEALAAMGPNRPIGSVADEGVADALTDLSGYPFAAGGTYTTGDTATGMVASLLGIPLASPGVDLELSKLDSYAENARINTVGTQSGTHQLLALHARRWSPEKREDWKKMVIQKNIAAEVIGPFAALSDYEFKVKLMGKQNPAFVEPGKGRYLPDRLINTNEQLRRVLV